MANRSSHLALVLALMTLSCAGAGTESAPSRPAGSSLVVSGRVVTETGGSVAGATIRVAGDSITSDSAGAFRLIVRHRDAAAIVTVAAGGGYAGKFPIHLAGADVAVDVVVSRAPRATGRIARLAFSDPASPSAQLSSVMLAASERTTAASTELDRFYLRDLRARIDRASELEVTRALLIAYFADTGWTTARPTEEDRRLAVRLLTTVPAASALWQLVPRAASHAALVVGTDAAPVVAAIARRLDAEAGGELVLSLVEHAHSRGSRAEVDQLVSIVRDEFANTTSAALVTRYADDRRIRTGAVAPALDVPLYRGGGRLASEGLAGAPYLVHLWSSRCDSCVADLGALHELHDAYGEHGLHLVAINVGDRPAEVDRFRAGRWPMPWRHVVLPAAAARALQAEWEAVRLPASILVGADGIVVATETEMTAPLGEYVGAFAAEQLRQATELH